mgnify:CR=1 FL=1
MSEKIEKQLTILNQLYKEQDNIYRELAAHFDLSDASFWVLYAICESDLLIKRFINKYFLSVHF